MKTETDIWRSRSDPLAAAAAVPALSQETESAVPELSAFHEVIYPIWHTAYPEKDIAMLKSLVPQVNELAAKVFAAKLPGILRDKQAKYDAGLAEFRKSVEAYNAAAKGSDDKAMLDAAEAPAREIRGARPDHPARARGDGRLPQGPLRRLPHRPAGQGLGRHPGRRARPQGQGRGRRPRPRCRRASRPRPRRSPRPPTELAKAARPALSRARHPRPTARPSSRRS
ncbi:MAG: hypothetical protein M0C28_40405 [Candidatus Moduliflexus flocculans]|nr:hypothetical protein [Candidatus Moduliflexus flocculans]